MHAVAEIRSVDVSAIREIDRELMSMSAADCPVTHRFTPGLCTREIFMPAGTAIRSKIHKTHHQFIVSQGAAFVSENGGPRFQVVAPYHGITKAGTWRTLYIIMDCIWTTMHVTDKTTVEEVEREIIAPMEEPT